jgi:hypothetical protein
MTVNQILKEVKKEFNERKNEGCVVIDNMVSRYGDADCEEKLAKDAETFKEVVKQLKNTRGVYDVIAREISYGGGYYPKKVITTLRLLRKPCKEFSQLNNYLQKYTSVKPLKWDDVQKQLVSGKRSYYDVNEERLLMHSSKLCAEILAWLRKTKATTYNVSVEFRQDSEKSSGYREEREWEGYFDDYLVIELYTKKGNKLKTRATFHVM